MPLLIAASRYHLSPCRLNVPDCKAAAAKLGLPYRELSFYGAVVLMMKGLYTTGRDELALRADRRKYSRAQAYMGAAGAVIETLKAD